MKPVQKSIVWFKDIGKTEIPLAGGRGDNLGEPSVACIPVPPGFCVNAQPYFRFFDKAQMLPLLLTFPNLIFSLIKGGKCQKVRTM